MTSLLLGKKMLELFDAV